MGLLEEPQDQKPCRLTKIKISQRTECIVVENNKRLRGAT